MGWKGFNLKGYGGSEGERCKLGNFMVVKKGNVGKLRWGKWAKPSVA